MQGNAVLRPCPSGVGPLFAISVSWDCVADCYEDSGSARFSLYLRPLTAEHEGRHPIRQVAPFLRIAVP
jgi:hypothetical protein